MPWTHNMCFGCWKAFYPDRVPTRLIDPHKEECCFCGKINVDGISVRHNPTELSCSHSEKEKSL